MHPSRLAPILLLCAVVCTPLPAADTASDLEIGLVLGYDTNPLEVSGDAGSGSFAEFRLDTGARIRFLDGRAGMFLDADGSARNYQSSVSYADDTHLDARAMNHQDPFK